MNSLHATVKHSAKLRSLQCDIFVEYQCSGNGACRRSSMLSSYSIYAPPAVFKHPFAMIGCPMLTKRLAQALQQAPPGAPAAGFTLCI